MRNARKEFEYRQHRNTGNKTPFCGLGKPFLLVAGVGNTGNKLKG
jgi:hypothetical protein